MKRIKILSSLVCLALTVAVILSLSVTAGAVNYGFFSKDPISPDSYAYSMAIVGDTQTLAYSDVQNSGVNGYEKRLEKVYDWLVANEESKKIEMVIGLGDITETWNEAGSPEDFKAEWELAADQISKLDGAKIPYTLVRGNHDTENGFEKYIGGMTKYADQFTGASLGGEFMYVDENGKPTKTDTAYRKITIGNNNWLIVTLDWCTTEGELDWAADVIKANPTYNVIVTMHSYLYHDMTVDGKGDTQDTARPNPNWDDSIDPTADNGDDLVYNPDGIWERLISKYSNIKMVISGHVTNPSIQHSQVVGDNGNTITQLLVNPQSMDLDKNNEGGCGMVCMLYFKEDGSLADSSEWDGKNVNVEWYSTIKNQYYRDDNQFEIDLSLYDGGSATENYGIIPSKYADTEAYPFALFGYDADIDEYFFHGAYSDWSTGNGVYPALSKFSGAAKKAEAFILLRRDYIFDDGVSYQMGKLTVTANLDLDGHTITTTTDNKPFFATNIANNSVSTLNVYGKEGSAFLNGSEWRSFIAMGSDKGGNGASFTYNFTGITFGFVKGSSSEKLIAETFSMEKGTNGQETTNQYLNFTDCTFDLTNKVENKTVTLFLLNENVGDGNNVQKASVTVNGGTIIDSDFTKVSLVAKNDDDSFVFGKGSSGYSTLKLTSENSSLDAYYPTNTEGKYVGFSAPDTSSGAYVYQLKETEAEVTDYGIIYESEYPVASNPFVLFQNGRVVKGYSSYFAFLNDAATVTVDSTLFLRTDYTTGTEDDDNLKESNSNVDRYLYNIKAHLTIDLNRNVLTRGDKHLLQIFCYGKSYSITVKNGTLNATEGTVNPINDTGSKAAGTVTLTFENVRFESGASTQYPFVDAYAGGTGETVNITYNNCVFSTVGNTATGAVLFDMKDDKDKFNINLSFNGCDLIFDATSFGRSTFATYNENDSVTFGTYNEKGTTLTIPSLTHPEFVIKTKGGAQAAPLSPVTVGDNRVYTMTAVSNELTEVDGLGTIPAEYPAERYPFALFDESGFVKAYCTWYHVLSVIGADADFKASDSPVLYLRRNYSTSECNTSSQGLYSIGGRMILDLNGKTFTRGSYHMFQAYGKSTSSTGTSTEIVIKNGYLLNAGSIALIAFNNSGSVGARAQFTFTFENVEFGIAKGATHSNFIIETFTGGAYGNDATVTFNDCIFNLTNDSSIGTVAPSKAITLFNLKESSGNKNYTKVIINGGKIKAETFDDVKIYAVNEPTASGADSVLFAKTDGGNYTALVLPKGASAPTENLNGLVFVKVSESADSVTYRLRPEAVSSIDFVPKMSITLDRNLILNVYVPKENLVKFTFDGVDYEDLAAIAEKTVTVDGKEYYLISAELSASDAAKTVKLIATVSAGEENATATFSFGIIGYAEKVIANGIDAEVTLVKDVLSYVRAAYRYFETQDADAIAKIDAILGENYDENNAPALNGSAEKPTVGLSGVTYILDSTPAIRFYISGEADSYAFYVNGDKLNTVVGTDENGTFIEMDVYAYAMGEAIHYTVDGVESGSYHINCYYTFVTTDEKHKDNAELISLVARFARYCESAAAYRDYVLQNS